MTRHRARCGADKFLGTKSSQPLAPRKLLWNEIAKWVSIVRIN